jgi:hypothetical protein
MNLERLTDVIRTTASRHSLDENAIVDELIAIVQLKYGHTLAEHERKLMEELRTKILTRLYNTEGHIIARRDVDVPKYLKLDALEVRLLGQAETELASEGLVLSDKNKLQLTEAGILRFKKIYGEL